MSRWFRHYAGMMRDDKLVRVAIKCGQSVERVVWIWGAILESAAEIDSGGRFDIDAAEIAYFLRADESDVVAVLTGLADAGRVTGDHVTKWGERQFTSDRSAARQAAYRDRKRAEKRHGDDDHGGSDGGVTSLSRHGDAPETETDTEVEGRGSEDVSSSEINPEKQRSRARDADVRTPPEPPDPPPDELGRVMALLEANPADVRWAEAPSILRRWADAGYDFEAVVWPVISEKVAVLRARKRQLPATLRYFEAAIIDRANDPGMPPAPIHASRLNGAEIRVDSYGVRWMRDGPDEPWRQDLRGMC